MLLELPNNTNLTALTEALAAIGIALDPHQDPTGVVRTRPDHRACREAVRADRQPHQGRTP